MRRLRISPRPPLASDDHLSPRLTIGAGNRPGGGAGCGGGGGPFPAKGFFWVMPRGDFFPVFGVGAFAPRKHPAPGAGSAPGEQVIPVPGSNRLDERCRRFVGASECSLL